MSCSHPSPQPAQQPAPQGRRFLPMLGLTHGRRSAVTCHLKCADQCSKPAPNVSGNGTFESVVSDLTRRNLLKGAGALAFLAGGAFSLANPLAAAAKDGNNGKGRGNPGKSNPGKGKGRTRVADFEFDAIAPVARDVDSMTVPAGFESHVILRWGDPLFSGVPAFDITQQTAALQAKRFGYNNDYLDIIELDGHARHGATRALLTCNHEYTNDGLMYPPGATGEAELENLRVSMQAVGFSIVDLARKKHTKPWTAVVDGPHNRRITATTKFVLDGPGAGSEHVKTAADPTGTIAYGTFANCSGGTTPWGTVLSGEENFHGYFNAPETPENARYGLAPDSAGYGYEKVDPRFDATLTGGENEPNRFGYVIEIDPHDPTSTPVKHTALGRFKHEGANVHINAEGHAVAYMGDDERFEYIYRFVSADKYREGDREFNKTLLSAGDLYVARFNAETGADGAPTGEWLPLMVGGESMIEGMSVEQICVFTRLAADQAGATKMDRPEDVDIHPITGRVYAACTNNTSRTAEQVDAANPRANNKTGQIIEITETADPLQFTWTLLLLAGTPKDAKVVLGGVEIPVAPLSCPDNLAFDSEGHLWISTDGQPGTIGYNDGLYRVYLEGDKRGTIEQFLAVPAGAETCGPVIHDRDGSVFVAVQHPGEDGEFDAPASYWPDVVKSSPAPGQVSGPRPSVVQVVRKGC
ncbi:PhoX family phosphatase [Micrococcales bacterium 31B]|nr:PhoX family phosphatase [Micrococcales bacterium 31B]